MFKAIKLTRLSLSFGGSWGSIAECLGVDEDCLGFSVIEVISTLGVCLSSSVFSTGWDGWEAVFPDIFSDGATWATPSSDFEITAILVPGSTVSPSLATNWKQLFKI